MEQSVKQRIADIRQGNVPAGYRKTKLGIIPADWNVELLGSIFVARDERVDNSFDTPLFSLTIEDGITAKTERYEREFLVKKEKNYKKVYPGDFVYNPMNLRFGAIARYHGNTPCSVSGYYDVFYLKNPSFYGDFIETLLQSDILLKEYANAATGSLIEKQRVHFSNFCKIGFMQPNELEITKIAKILGCCDRVIALKKELIAEKKKQKKALMQKLLNPDSGFRLPGFSGEWKNIVLEDICSFAGGGTPDTKREDFWNGTIPWISSADVEEKNFSVNPHRFITPEAIKFSATQLCPQKSLLIVSRVGVGKIAITQEPLCTSQDFTNLTKINGNVIFYAYLLKTILEAKARQTQGTSIKGITVAEIKHFQLAVPQSLKEQQAIADILSAADKEIDLLEQELVQQEQKKKSLMQLLLTGIVRV